MLYIDFKEIVSQHFHSVLIAFQIIYSGCRFHLNYLHKCFITGNQIWFLDGWETKNLDWDSFLLQSIWANTWIIHQTVDTQLLPNSVLIFLQFLQLLTEHLKNSSRYDQAHSWGLKGLNWGFSEYKWVPTTNLYLIFLNMKWKIFTLHCLMEMLILLEMERRRQWLKQGFHTDIYIMHIFLTFPSIMADKLR